MYSVDPHKMFYSVQITRNILMKVITGDMNSRLQRS